MKTILKESHRVVYEMRTHQIVVEIDGVEYIIRNAEDDNGVEYHVLSDNLNGGQWMKPHEIEDEELKDAIEKLANAAYDDYIFGESKVGKEVDMEELEDY